MGLFSFFKKRQESPSRSEESSTNKEVVGLKLKMVFSSREKDWDSVISAVDQITRLAPDDELAIFNRAFAYHMKGDYGKAARDFRRVVSMGGKNSEQAKKMLSTYE